jgi:hypothetical protein
VKDSKKNSTYSHTNIRSYLTVEFLKKDFFFAWPFSGLHGGSFSVFLEKHSQGTLGVNVFLKNKSIPCFNLKASLGLGILVYNW